MSRYIDAVWLQFKMTAMRGSSKGNMDRINTLWEVQDAIQQMPAADVRKNVHGEWVWDDSENCFLCSKCGNGYKNQPTLMGEPMFLFCPCCGAKMRGKEDE